MIKINLPSRLKEVFHRFQAGREALLRSASGAVLLTILVTLIGLVGGLYATTLRSHYPWCLIEGKACITEPTTVGYVIAFYLSLLLFGLLFYLRERTISAHAEQREKELLSAIRTMPPADVMHSFQVAYKLFLSRVEESDLVACNGYGNLEVIDEGIRNGLDAMTLLAAEFQRVPGARYAANIMLFRSILDINEEDYPEAVNRLGFFLDGYSLDGLDGILDLMPELSASTDNEEDTFDPDPSLKPIALPVPSDIKSKNNGQKRYLPGAPTALIEGRYLVNDTLLILNSYDELKDYDIPRGIFQKIDDYFRCTEEGQKVRSFMSLLLYYREPGDAGNERGIGVVNIHSNDVDLFANNELAAHYESLCQPFILGLARMIQNRKRVQELLNG